MSLCGPRGQQITLRQGVQFHPLGLAASGASNDVPVVFAGYGITVNSKTLQYDDYDGIDASGKVVIVLRDTPLATNRWASFDGQNRRRHGARRRR